jgi:hypothetical protein
MGDQSAQRVPNADRALVEERKILEYLLNLKHADGGPKASFLLARGFTLDAWDVLQASLIIQGQTNAGTGSIDTE